MLRAAASWASGRSPTLLLSRVAATVLMRSIMAARASPTSATKGGRAGGRAVGTAGGGGAGGGGGGGGRCGGGGRFFVFEGGVVEVAGHDEPDFLTVAELDG